MRWDSSGALSTLVASPVELVGDGEGGTGPSVSPEAAAALELPALAELLTESVREICFDICFCNALGAPPSAQTQKRTVTSERKNMFNGAGVRTATSYPRTNSKTKKIKQFI